MRQHTSRGALLASNLPQLQNLIKRDPVGYRDEFLQQWNNYNSIREIFSLKPDEQAHHFRELTAFISQVASCYPSETSEFPSHVSRLLLENFTVLSQEMRRSLVQSLVTLSNKGVISPETLLQSLFPLLPRCSLSSLRASIRKTILTVIRTANSKTKNHKLNRVVQGIIFGMVDRGMESERLGDKGKAKSTANLAARQQQGSEAMWAVIIAKELWKKAVWSDAKTVSILTLGVFHPAIKVQSASIHFFLGSWEDEETDSEDESEDEIDVRGMEHRREINKKTRSGDKKFRKAIKVAQKKKKEDRNKTGSANFPAMQLMNDPQTFAEKLHDSLMKQDKIISLDHKVLIMKLLSRVMGLHQLCILPFYSYCLKYLSYHQLHITSILACVAQSVHELTPPDVLTPVVRKIAQEFIHPGVAAQVVSVGLNSIREICRRQPWCMEEDLLGDLVEYKKSRDKAVMSASRSLLQLYRELNPAMLKRRDRGKDASMNTSSKKLLPYGHMPAAPTEIDGIELLEEHLRRAEDDDELERQEDEWRMWDVESASAESLSDGWQDVSSDEEGNIEISDSEDEDLKGNGGQESVAQIEHRQSESSQVRSTIMTTKILTPADFALLNELRSKTTADDDSKRAAKRRFGGTGKSSDGASFLSDAEILGPRKKSKLDYEERIASIQKGREGREKFGSMKGKRRKETPSSTTNKAKAKNKPFMMIMASGSVKGKRKASLREKQKRLRAHIERSKKR